MDQALAELPPVIKAPQLLPFRITTENASEYGKRSGIAKRKNAASRAITPSLISVSPLQQRAELVAEQIVRTRKELNKDTIQPRERAQLLIALDRLLDRERILQGQPLPGSHRPSNRPGKSNAGPLAPEE